MLLRGALRRCPWCSGRGAFFTSWFDKDEACRTCGLRWRRDDVGFELGAAAMASMIVLTPIIAGIALTLAFTWPEVEVVPMLIGCGVAGIVLPIVLYPVSYTMWQAVDLVARPVSVDDFDPAAVLDWTATPDGADGSDVPGDDSGTLGGA